MSDIVISGYYGFNNAGDEAMLAAIVRSVAAVEPAVRFTVLSVDPALTVRQHGVAAVHRLNYPEIVKVLRHADLLISGGGSLLQDVTSERSLYYYLSIILMAKKLGKPVMLYAQGIGPVEGALARHAVRVIGNMADLITVRDTGSAAELAVLGVRRPPVYVTADPVLTLPPADRRIGQALLEQAGVYAGGKPLILFSVRKWENWAASREGLARIADWVQREMDAAVVFLPMQWPEDVQAAEDITRHMHKPAAILYEQYTTEQLLSIVGQAELLVGIRLHALIFAAVMEVPLVGISYDPKVDRFLETLGDRPAGRLAQVDTAAVMAAIRHRWENRREIRKDLADHMAVLRERAMTNAILAVRLAKTANETEAVPGSYWERR